MLPKVRKAIIPAAGFGTRMLPATKSIPKELLTIVDRPVLDYAVHEALSAGIEHIVIVTGRMKNALEEHFDHAFELDHLLRHNGKGILAEELVRQNPGPGAISFVRQQETRGLGHAIWIARHIIGNEPFAIMLPDMLMTGSKPCLQDMVCLYEQYGGNIISVQQCAPDETHKFGIVSLVKKNKQSFINGMVEKPEPQNAPSNLFISGRYILQPEIFDHLEHQKPGVNNEIQLTDALISLLKTQDMRPFEFSGRTFDCGSPQGFITANLYMALQRESLAEPLKKEIQALLNPPSILSLKKRAFS